MTERAMVIDRMARLQHDLRKSEQDSLKLGQWFTILTRACREKKEADILKLKKQYEDFLEKDKTHRENFKQILDSFVKADKEIDFLNDKTQRMKLLRQRYEKELQEQYPHMKIGDILKNEMTKVQPENLHLLKYKSQTSDTFEKKTFRNFTTSTQQSNGDLRSRLSRIAQNIQPKIESPPSSLYSNIQNELEQNTSGDILNVTLSEDNSSLGQVEIKPSSEDISFPNELRVSIPDYSYKQENYSLKEFHLDNDHSKGKENSLKLDKPELREEIENVKKNDQVEIHTLNRGTRLDDEKREESQNHTKDSSKPNSHLENPNNDVYGQNVNHKCQEQPSDVNKSRGDMKPEFNEINESNSDDDWEWIQINKSGEIIEDIDDIPEEKGEELKLSLSEDDKKHQIHQNDSITSPNKERTEETSGDPRERRRNELLILGELLITSLQFSSILKNEDSENLSLKEYKPKETIQKLIEINNRSDCENIEELLPANQQISKPLESHEPENHIPSLEETNQNNISQYETQQEDKIQEEPESKKIEQSPQSQKFNNLLLLDKSSKDETIEKSEESLPQSDQKLSEVHNHSENVSLSNNNKNKPPTIEKKIELVSHFDHFQDDENSISESSSDFWDLDGEQKSTTKKTTEYAFNLNTNDGNEKTSFLFKEPNKNNSPKQKININSDTSSESSDIPKPATDLTAQLSQLNIGIGNLSGGILKDQLETESETSDKEGLTGPTKEEESDFEFLF